jgi:hypothetical protein
MKLFFLALVCAAMAGCMVQDAHDARVQEQCEDHCREQRDCFPDQKGRPMCGRKARCKARCAANPMQDDEHLSRATMDRLRAHGLP